MDQFPRWISIPRYAESLLEKYISKETRRIFMHRLYMVKQDIPCDSDVQFTVVYKI